MNLASRMWQPFIMRLVSESLCLIMPEVQIITFEPLSARDRKRTLSEVFRVGDVNRIEEL